MLFFQKETPHHYEQVYIRSMHPAAYRSGQWAEIVAVVYIPETFGGDPKPGRACYKVRFVDGTTDLWVIHDPQGQYEYAGYIK